MQALFLGALLAIPALHVVAHPMYLECNGLSESIQFHTKVMGYVPKNSTAAEAGVTLKAASTDDEGTAAAWRNFTVQITPGFEMFVQTTDGSPITQFNDGLCGSPPNPVGHGLCQKCASSMYAMSYDCTAMTCAFGVKGAKGKVPVLIGTSQGLHVMAALFHL